MIGDESGFPDPKIEIFDNVTSIDGMAEIAIGVTQPTGSLDFFKFRGLLSGDIDFVIK